MSGPTRLVEFSELASLALGTGILGTGGGTHPYLELLNIEKLYQEGRSVRLIDPNDLGDEDLVAELGYMGAPLVTKERLPDPDHICRPVRLMAEHTGARFTAVMAGEVGAENGILPFLVAAMLDLPVVDVDTMGRAFPEIQMSSLVIRGLPLVPFALCDVRANDVLLTRSNGPIAVERIGRKICTEMGSVAATCRPPRRGRDIKAHGVLHSVSRAIRLGAAVRSARARHADPVETILEAEHGLLLFRGKVVDVARRTTEGFVRGVARIEGFDDFESREFQVDFQNEFTIGRLDGQLTVMVPDLLCILDAVSGEAIGTETIRYGQRVAIVSLPAANVLVSEEGLNYVGPRAFGYDLDFISLHERRN
ncbi:MAG TPA: DUF917 domain-containing protein [Alphaproteobacteria bacterium]|nr:DUF917 domain-containing protein [Alphaproteobacteria bacterium]